MRSRRWSESVIDGKQSFIGSANLTGAGIGAKGEPWIDAVRATVPGRLVLGSTFNWPDVPAYALGIAIGAWPEWRLRQKLGRVAR